MSLSADLLARIRAASDDHGGPRPAMLEALRMIQHEHGWVSDAHLAEAAATLGVHRAEMEALASFYSLIFRHPVGETVILLCDGASCWLNGADAVREGLKARLGIGFGQTTPDGRYTLLNVACLGGCDRAPAAVVGRDRRLIGPLSPEGVAELLEGGL
ncbi:NADH-quinone oxidoreductase subunit NuoE [Cereibacter sphaeroides]|uniref:NADH-quinone oxidoreductase subunit NuoE n=1 Tax=Cereibacter sphaeroides TaxID=1063 RepID=UPI001F46CDD4|nr:NADH-quinone oxidoreductase subunit NuoE [Cereibacter sphaeroides]MCE6953033.1 NADH-quinone oxidoreductase subunit NuoE [Cereibacter sphaeroides]